MLHGLLGCAALLVIAYLFSESRRSVAWRTVVAGVALQWIFAVMLMWFAPARSGIRLLNDGATALQNATDTGTGFLFGYLGGAPLPFAETHPGASFILAFKALPLVLVISALASVLFHWGILQRITGAFAWLLRRVMGIGGALALGAAVHVFVGMIEAPLLVRPYLAKMQRGELFALMTCGMAGVAGTVMVIYAGFLSPVIPDALGHILTASIISTPAALAISALMVPFGAAPAEARISVDNPPSSTLDAVVRGTMDGIPVLAGIVALLLVTVALVSLINMALGLLPFWDGAITLQRIFALPFRPVMWLIGVPWEQSAAAAGLMGTKTVLNEFVAYLGLAGLPADALSPHSRLIVTYALCGFANFGSLGIMIGGLGVMVPERRQEIVGMGLRSILAGTLATCSSGAVIGVLTN